VATVAGLVRAPTPSYTTPLSPCRCWRCWAGRGLPSTWRPPSGPLVASSASSRLSFLLAIWVLSQASVGLTKSAAAGQPAPTGSPKLDEARLTGVTRGPPAGVLAAAV